MRVRVNSENRGGNGCDEEWAESVDDVDAVLPKMGFANKRRSHPHSGLSADRESGVIVRVNVVF